MPVHLHREIGNLKKMILALGAQVESNLYGAVAAVEERDGKKAEEIINADRSVDEAEIEVEEEGLKILALHQPVAIDLRFIVAVLKINAELERIGDLAVNIAERAAWLSQLAPPAIDVRFNKMAEGSQKMLRESLDALVNLDTELARQVCAADDEIDEMNRENYERVKKEMMSSAENFPIMIHLLSISRLLERVADHATNIAEDVIYMVEGEIVRHHVAETP